MCVSAKLAMFAGTKGYIGEVTHPQHGFIHVLGYQNSAVNLAPAPNAMILPFPAAAEMTKDNVIDIGNNKKIINNMIESLNPTIRTLSLTNSARKSARVEVFQHGIYHVVLASDPKLVTGALSQVPEDKRPEISPELMEWYSWRYPEHHIAVCCFNNLSRAESEPIFWWYKPKDMNTLFFPAVDSHSGKLPNLRAEVMVDHNIVVGCNRASEETTGMIGTGMIGTGMIGNNIVKYMLKKTAPDVAEFLATHLFLARHERETMLNGDFVGTRGDYSLRRLTYLD